MQVYDMLGRRVLDAPLATGKTTLDITGFQAGTYLWRILEGGIEKEKGKFVKE
jgi:hypothetical protein